jgi:hypothetical protein
MRRMRLLSSGKMPTTRVRRLISLFKRSRGLDLAEGYVCSWLDLRSRSGTRHREGQELSHNAHISHSVPSPAAREFAFSARQPLVFPLFFTRNRSDRPRLPEFPQGTGTGPAANNTSTPAS